MQGDLILNSKLKILRYWYEMMIVDHGFLRLLYNNFHKIDDNMYRSNMPTPQRIKKYKKLGIRTIITVSYTHLRAHETG